ncbi:hypothetical protein ANCDUO_05569 [Ancylostoma duodenale]|uniref:RING-type domain-containing protein n=1 Tax=Ancylostoma duodenale TaxID=51022 RepID=A0A0C2GYC6_9BILA|nr:hypothetical protein ANCDUO_05569 [Ancylostoma duodenale]
MNDCSSGRLVSFLVEGDDVVSCEVCLEPFQPVERPPKILPCGHNFCDQCLFSLCCHQQIFYCLECCVNKHNGHSLLSLSQLQTAQLKGELNDALTALDDAIRLIESTSVLHPHKLNEIQTKQVRKCSRLLCCSKELREVPGSGEISSLVAFTQRIPPNGGLFADVSCSSLYQRISTPRAKSALDVGSLDFLLAALPKLLPGSELLRLLEKTSVVDTAEQRLETFLKAAAIITTVLYEYVPYWYIWRLLPHDYISIMNCP